MALVRRAAMTDAEGIAAVHVASWQTTYEDLLPPSYLEARSLPVRVKFWTDTFAGDDPEVCVFAATLDDGSICGFASGGPERTGLLDRKQELYSIYLLDRAQGKKLGRRLVEAVLAELGGSAAVWVLAVNPACGFYERLGGKWLTQREVDLDGERFTEVAYDLGPNFGL